MLWSRPGADDDLVAYEDRVLALMREHGGRVLQRVRTDGACGAPLEIQILEFQSDSALDAYLADDRRASLSSARHGAIARTDTFHVDLVGLR